MASFSHQFAVRTRDTDTGPGGLPRIRDMTDAFGATVRLTMEVAARGPVLAIERTDAKAAPRILLDLYAADLLHAYLLATRVAPGQLPDETVRHPAPLIFRYVSEPAPAILLIARDVRPLTIPAPLCDRLYAELGLALAHMRALTAALPAR